LHVNTFKIEKHGESSVFEVNGSHEPTRIRARLFLEHELKEEAKKENKSSASIQSGDVIRLFHKEANGYLTVDDKDVEHSLPRYPDFLRK